MCFLIDKRVKARKARVAFKLLERDFTDSKKFTSPYYPRVYRLGQQKKIRKNAKVTDFESAHEGLYVYTTLEGARHMNFGRVIVKVEVDPADFIVASPVRNGGGHKFREATYRRIRPVEVVK